MAVSKPLKLAVDNAAQFALSVGENKIETEHLLYGILSVSDSKASKLLASFGLQASSYKKVILSLLKKKKETISSPVGLSKAVAAIFAKTDKFLLNVHHDFKWLKLDELNTLDWAPADMPIVEKLQTEISKN